MRKILFFILISFTAAAQLSETASSMIFLNENYNEDFEMIINDDDFLLVNVQENIYNRREKNLNLILYNQDLKEIQNLSIPIKSYKNEVGYKLKNGYLYYLLSEQNSKELELIVYDVRNNQWSSHEFKMLTGLINFDFDIFNGLILLIGEYSYKPIIELHNLVNNTVIVLPEIHYKNKEIQNLFINPYRNEIYVVITDANKCSKSIFSFNEEGRFISKVQLGDKKHVLHKIEMRFNFNGDPIIMGTYNSSCGDLSVGFFSGKTEKHGQLNFTPIAELPSYYGSLKESTRKRWSLRKEKGKNVVVRQRILLNIPFYTETGFLAIAESYNHQTPSNALPNTAYRNSSKKDFKYPYEYKVSSIMFLELGFNGSVLKDNIKKIEGSTFAYLEPQSSYLIENDSLYSLLPVKKNIAWFNMSNPNPKVEIFPIFTDSQYRISNFDLNLMNLNHQAVLAYGFADILFNRNQQSVMKKSFFIKKLEINTEI